MPTAIKTRNGIGWIEAGEGVGPIRNFTGASPGGPILGVIFIVRQTGVNNIGGSIVIAPNVGGGSGYNDGPSETEPDSGTYEFITSIVFGFIPSVEYPHRWYTGGGWVDFPDGVLNTDVTAVSSQPTEANFDFEVWLHYASPGDSQDWGGSPPADDPANANFQHEETDELEDDLPTGNKNETFTWDIPTEDLIGTVVSRDGEFIDTVAPGIGTYTDTVPPGDYVYTFQFYQTGGNGISEPFEYPLETGDAIVDIPLISMTMSGGINFGGAPLITMLVNPSGIYTLVAGKRHDTLYERIPTITSIDVKIPDPFIKSAYLPEK